MSSKSNNGMSGKTFGRVMEIDDATRKSFREKREQRQAELKAKIAAQRLEKNTGKEGDGSSRPIMTKPVRKIEKPLQDVKKTTVKSVTVVQPPKQPLVPVVQSSKKPIVREIKQTKASQLRIKKNNPLIGLDAEQFKKLLAQASATSSTTSVSTKQPFRSTPFKAQTLRRSISAVHIKKLNPSFANKCVHTLSCSSRLSKARSEESIGSPAAIHIPSPVPEEPRLARTEHVVAFNTPESRRKSVHYQVGSTPAPSELRERLLNWLRRRGKSLNAYNHLRCFGVHQATPYRPSRKSMYQRQQVVDDDEDDEDKENREDLAIAASSVESVPKVVDYTNMTTNEDLFGTPASNGTDIADMNKLAQDTLCDVHALILDNYPQDQCLAWLSALKRKYPTLQEQPQYWECCAAIGEINGEITEAVDCYQQAIIKGAQVAKIDHSIEKMLEKFSVLKIDSSMRNLDTPMKKSRSKTLIDVRNIFKSSVIKFAVKERESRLKNSSQMASRTPLVAHPVRRSTRLSMNCSTPNTRQVYKSIKEIETSLHRNVNFEQNPALHD